LLLLCDEPTSALDNVNSTLIKSILKDYSKNNCVVIITHDLSFLDIADHKYYIKNNIIIEDRGV
jgi:ABC-type lipoprotein export system ATPase subunit